MQLLEKDKGMEAKLRIQIQNTVKYKSYQSLPFLFIQCNHPEYWILVYSSAKWAFMWNQRNTFYIAQHNLKNTSKYKLIGFEGWMVTLFNC